MSRHMAYRFTDPMTPENGHGSDRSMARSTSYQYRGDTGDHHCGSWRVYCNLPADPTTPSLAHWYRAAAAFGLRDRSDRHARAQQHTVGNHRATVARYLGRRNWWIVDPAGQHHNGYRCRFSGHLDDGEQFHRQF